MFRANVIDSIVCLTSIYRDDLANYIENLVKASLEIYSINKKKKSVVYRNNKNDNSFIQNELIMEFLHNILELKIKSIENLLYNLVSKENDKLKPAIKRDDENLIGIIKRIPINRSKSKKFHQSFDDRKIFEIIKTSPRHTAEGSYKHIPTYINKSANNHTRSEKNSSILPSHYINSKEDFYGGESLIDEVYPIELGSQQSRYVSPLGKKALKAIEKIKQKKEEKIEKQMIEENKKRIDDIKRKRGLQRRMNILQINHCGKFLTNGNSSRINPLLEVTEGECDRIMQKLQPLPEIHLLLPDEEEQKDINSFKTFINENKKTFYQLFITYSNSAFANKRFKFYESKEDKDGIITLIEIGKMLKEHGIMGRSLSYLEFTTIVRMINSIIYNKKNTTELTFEGFIEFIKQMMVYINNKSPYSSKDESPVILVKKFLGKLNITMRNRPNLSSKTSTNSSLNKSILLKKINPIIDNAKTLVPFESYNKLLTKEMVEQYTITPRSYIPESTKISAEIIDSIVASIFGSHFIEPIVSEQSVYKVTPIVKIPRTLITSENHNIFKKRKCSLKDSIIGNYTTTTKRYNIHSNNKFERKYALTPIIQSYLSNSKDDYKKEVIEVVADIVDSIASGIPYKREIEPIINQVQKERIQKEKEIIIKEKAKEEKRRRRQQILKEILKKNEIKKIEEKKNEEIKVKEKLKIEKQKELTERLKREEIKQYKPNMGEAKERT